MNRRYRRVIKTYLRDPDCDLVGVFAGSAIESTYHHPYWVVEGENLSGRPEPDHVRAITVRDAIFPGRWVDAGDLRIGDLLLLQDGSRLPIEEIILRQATCRVYNLAVEGLRNYAVGSCYVLARNKCGVSTSAHARAMAKDLTAHGNPRPPGYQASHIVPGAVPIVRPIRRRLVCSLDDVGREFALIV